MCYVFYLGQARRSNRSQSFRYICMRTNSYLLMEINPIFLPDGNPKRYLRAKPSMIPKHDGPFFLSTSIDHEQGRILSTPQTSFLSSSFSPEKKKLTSKKKKKILPFQTSQSQYTILPFQLIQPSPNNPLTQIFPQPNHPSKPSNQFSILIDISNSPRKSKIPPLAKTNS